MTGLSFDVAGAVGAGFSPEEIVSELMAHPEDLPEFDIRGAVKAGVPASDIIDELNPKADKINVQGVPILAPIDRGIAHLRAGAANLATDMGATNVGSYLRQSIPTATLAAPMSGQAVSSALARRDYLAALSNLPSAVLEQAAPVAGAVVTGVASGGSVPAALAAGAGIGATTQGDAIARQRAANNGRQAPDASDLALGLGGGAVTGAVGALGLGGAGSGLANAARATLLHASADAAQPELTALAGSVGTDQGTQNASPVDMAASALTGLGTRGALSAPAVGRAAYEATPGGRQGALAAQFNAMSPADQANVANTAAAGKLLDSTASDVVPMGGKPTDAAVARTAGDWLDQHIESLSDILDRDGLMSDDGKDVIGNAWKAAADPNRALLNQHLDALDGIGLHPDIAASLKDSLIQRAMVANAGVDPETSTLGSLAGLAPRLAGRAMHAIVPTPVASLANVVLGPLSDAVSARLGQSDPALKTAGAKAAEMMLAAGQVIPDTYSGLTAAAAMQQNVVQAQARLMGLDPASAVPPQEADAVQATQPAPGSLEAKAVARAAAQSGIKGAGSGTSQGSSSNLAAPMPGMDGISDAAKLQGQLLPEWQWGLGKNLMDSLSLQGTPKPINIAQEVSNAVQNMSARGWFGQDFASTLMGHSGRVTRGIYNTIRNEMLMSHGIDRRTLDAQQAAP